MNELLDPTADQQFIVRRARELTAQMAEWNKSGGPYPTNVELQSWAGAATGILRMVADSD